MTDTIPNVPSELKPCPFCGDTPELPSGDGTQYEIECGGCGQAMASVQICDLMTIEERVADTFTDYRYGEEFVERAMVEAIERWNTRAPSPAGVDGCRCSMSISMLGDGCRYCQPQEYIDRLSEMLDEERDRLSDAQAIIDGLRGELEAAGEILAQQGRRNTELRKMRDQHAQRQGGPDGWSVYRDSTGAIYVGVSSRILPGVWIYRDGGADERMLWSYFDELLATTPASLQQSTDGGRNPRYEGLFDGETEEQRASRLAPVQPVSAKPTDHVEDVRAMVVPAGEAVEVVAYRVSLPSEPELGHWFDEFAESAPQMCQHEPLMTVAQHQRIVAQRDAENERLRVKLMTIASAEPRYHDLEWAKAHAAEGDNRAWVKWKEAVDKCAELIQCLRYARTTMATVAEGANLRGVEYRSLISEVKRIDDHLSQQAGQ